MNHEQFWMKWRIINYAILDKFWSTNYDNYYNNNIISYTLNQALWEDRINSHL